MQGEKRWTRDEDGNWLSPTGRYRVQRHEVDDRWDTGALVRVNVQWVREERVGDEWVPVELHNRLGDAKATAETREATS
jgi:hypothetical protein